jgi:hypothetical protein
MNPFDTRKEVQEGPEWPRGVASVLGTTCLLAYAELLVKSTTFGPGSIHRLSRHFIEQLMFLNCGQRRGHTKVAVDDLPT